MEQFHQAGRSNLGLHGSLRHGILAHGEFRLRAIGVGLRALSAAGERGRQFGELFRVVERLACDGLLLERPQEVEVSHGHEQQEVMGGGRGRVLPGRYLLAGDARLENRVRQGELGRQPGNRRRTAADRVHPQSGFQRRAAGHGDRAIAVLQRPVMVLVIDAGLNRRQPEDLGAPQLCEGFVDLFVGESDLRILPRDQRQGPGEADDFLVRCGRRGSLRLHRGQGQGQAGTHCPRPLAGGCAPRVLRPHGTIRNARVQNAQQGKTGGQAGHRAHGQPVVCFPCHVPLLARKHASKWPQA